MNWLVLYFLFVFVNFTKRKVNLPSNLRKSGNCPYILKHQEAKPFSQNIPHFLLDEKLDEFIWVIRRTNVTMDTFILRNMFQKHHNMSLIHNSDRVNDKRLTSWIEHSFFPYFRPNYWPHTWRKVATFPG